MISGIDVSVGIAQRGWIHRLQKQIVSFPCLSCRIAVSFHITSAVFLGLNKSLGFNQNSRDQVRVMTNDML